MAKKEQKISVGKAIIYGNPNYRYNEEAGRFIPTNEDDRSSVCTILDVQEVTQDKVITSHYVLPMSDATISTSDDGLVYSFNCSLPYLQETAHLAEIEKNTIMNQAFNYPGRTQQAKTSGVMWLLIGLLGLLAIIGMFK